MASTNYLEINPQGGIQRDGTEIDSPRFNNGIWMRSYKGRAKKIGGYKLIFLGDNEIIRNLFSVNSQNSIQLFVGQPSSLVTFNVFLDLSTTAPIDRTPVIFIPDPDNTWSFTTVTIIVDLIKTPFIVACAVLNGSDISNNVPGIIYAGVLNGITPLEPVLNTGIPVTTTGGIFSLGSVLIVYGENGSIIWNDGNSLSTWPSESTARFGTSKIVYAAPVRSGVTPTGLLWSLDGVISMTSSGITSLGNPAFTFAYISTITTILSQGCVVAYDPVFYWIGINTFYMFNGAVVEVENETNKLWFFENINQNAKEKVTGFVNKKYREVWWLFPKGDSLENNWALIYNMDKQEWYDTPIDRSCAVSSSSQMPYPIMASALPDTINLSTSYPLWAHEYGVNRVDPVQTSAIISSFTTNKTWLIDQNPEASVLIADTIIPDIKQTGNIILDVTTQGYPNSTEVNSPSFVIAPNTEFITIRQKGTIIAMTFTSNEVDGDYLFGKTMVKTIVSNDQRMGPSVA